MKKTTKIFLTIITMMVLLNPFIVKADSGLDSNYKASTSPVEAIFSAGSSCISFLAELINAEPHKEGYESRHIALTIICGLTLLIFSWVSFYKLVNSKNKKSKRVLKSLLYSLIPTILFILLCIFTKLQLVLYILILIIYIIPLRIVTKKIVKKILKKKLNKAKEIDKKFTEEEFGKEAFRIYSEIQLAWMDFKLTKVKDLLSKELYNKYKEQLKELKDKKQQNMMERLDYKSNKITDIIIDNDIETIECELNVTCFDYIVENKDKVVKGDKNKVCNYTYQLKFAKKIGTNNYVLVSKKMKKQK